MTYAFLRKASVAIMLLIQQTIEKFGHDPRELAEKSNKRIVMQCSDCSKQFERKRVDVRDLTDYQCRACASIRQVNKIAISSSAKKKRKQTTEQRYGVENPGQIPEAREKGRNTCLERYGEECFTKTQAWRNQVQKTNLTKFGKAWFFQSDESKDKTRQTLRRRYGVDWISKVEEVQEKIKKTCLDKYGVPNAAKAPAVIAKMLNTKMQRYGSTAPTGIGQEEQNIREWLLTLGVNAPKNHSIIPGKELDFYSDEHKVAIEYNGLYWHCEKHLTSKKSHYLKWEACRKQGVRLITIFEDEWLHRQAQVKNFLRSVLGKNDKLFARNCSVGLVEKTVAADFLERTHIQGAPHSFEHAAGLFRKTDLKLVGVMTIGKHHRGGSVPVLSRLSFEEGISVTGGSSKLLHFLIKTCGLTRVISWSDNRWSSGGVYRAMGFVESGALPADYSYVDTSASDVRRCSKQSKKKGLTGCPKEVKEVDWCRASGLYRIWDCGKIRWEWNKEKVNAQE